MSKLKIATGLLCVLVGACAGANGDVHAVTPATASASAIQSTAVKVGFTRGSMPDAEAQQWQADLLHAIGRDGQFALFNYVFVGDEANGNIYVGMKGDSLGLTPEQMQAASEVQKRYQSTKMHTTVLDGVWVASAWPETSAAVASNVAVAEAAR